jgi:predicted amidohydrolase YtcJ
LLACSLGHAQVADRIWAGGPILTMNDRAMRAEAVAEQGGRIVAVGSRATVMKLRCPTTGMTAETPDPPGGVIQRRQGSKEPNGVFEETAAMRRAQR